MSRLFANKVFRVALVFAALLVGLWATAGGRGVWYLALLGIATFTVLGVLAIFVAAGMNACERPVPESPRPKPRNKWINGQEPND